MFRFVLAVGPENFLVICTRLLLFSVLDERVLHFSTIRGAIWLQPKFRVRTLFDVLRGYLI